MKSERFSELWTDWLEGDLPPAGLSELESMLASDPELLKRAVDLYELHRGLGLVHQSKESGLFVSTTMARLSTDREAFVSGVTGRLGVRPAPRSRVAGYGLVIAATLAFSWVLQLLLTAPPTVPSPTVAPVATLLRADKARWEPEAEFVEGQRLNPGSFRLSRGAALLLFDGGAVVALEGPADFEVESRGSARIRHGRIVVRAENDAAGFTVHTPAGEVVDLGTEFVVSVELSGTTEVHVQEGEVSFSREPGHPASQALKGGQALRCEARAGAEAHSIAFIAHSFEDYLQQLTHEILPGRPTVVEDFAYPPGAASIGEASSGEGWSGSWRLRRGVEVTREADRSELFKILPDSLQGSWFPGTERGGSLELPPGQSFYVREMKDPVDLGRNAVYYVSFLVRREADAPPGSSETPHFRLTLRSSADYWGPSIALGLPLSRHPTIQFHSRGNFVAPSEVEVGAVSLWVAKVVANRSGSDEVFLKVYKQAEAVPRFEPAQWSVVTGPLVSDGRLDLVVVTGTGPATHVFDGLRIGRTWESVLRRD